MSALGGARLSHVAGAGQGALALQGQFAGVRLRLGLSRFALAEAIGLLPFISRC